MGGAGGKQGLISQHSNVTNNLKMISRQLAATVERSQLTVSNLEGSAKTLQEVDEEHRSLTGVIGQSKKLITKYMRREFTDKILIVFCAGLLLCCGPVYFAQASVPELRSPGGHLLPVRPHLKRSLLDHQYVCIDHNL